MLLMVLTVDKKLKTVENVLGKKVMLGIAQGLLRLLRTKPPRKQQSQLVVMYAPFKFGSEHNFLGSLGHLVVDLVVVNTFSFSV